MYEHWSLCIYINIRGNMEQKVRQNESALVYAAREGDKEAVFELINRNWAWLKGLVLGIVHDTEDTDDVLQDICVQVISKIDTLREPELFVRWLATLARREALQYIRRKRKRPVSIDEDIIDRQEDEKSSGQFENIELKEQHQQILDAIKFLPNKYRQVLIMQYTSGLTYAQIAEILDIPITTLQIRLVRARRMVSNQINKNKIKEGKI